MMMMAIDCERVKRFGRREGAECPERFHELLVGSVYVEYDKDECDIDGSGDWDFQRFVVMDWEFGMPYAPFYTVMSGKHCINQFAAKVVSRYNEVMSAQDWLVEL